MDYSAILDDFKSYITNDKTVKGYWNKVINKSATYKDAQDYSKRVGKWWSDALVKNYGAADYSDVISDIEKSIKKAYSESAYYAKNVQNVANEKAKIGMKALEPALDDERLTNLVSKLISEDAKFLLEQDAIENITRSAVTDTIEANARIQSEAGLPSYIERDTGAGCCAWCESIAGRYIYGEQPKEFFQVHKDCTCNITFMPSKRKWEKISYSGGRKITERI